MCPPVMSLHEQLAAFEARRASSDHIPAGIAPAISSDDFKTVGNGAKPKANTCDHWLSRECQERQLSTLKASASTASPSSMISRGTARPTSKYFPWESVTLRVPDCSSPRSNGTNPDSTALLQIERGDPTYDLDIVMNYGYAGGSPQLLRFIVEHIEIIHRPRYQDWSTCLTSGTTSAFDIVLRMLCNRGEWILTESFTYSGAIEASKPLGLKMKGLKMDEVGIIPEDLEDTLQSWDLAKGGKPFVLYTIPSGQNPTGVTQTNERRRAIYAVAERHDLCIIEDDPYFFLQLDILSADGDKQDAMDTRSEDYLKSLLRSYLSLDTSGRVLRLDATSKIIALGLPCGWITGCS